MRIWIDADASPRDVKEIVFRASKRLGVPVVLVANQSVGPTSGSLITVVVVAEGANMADRYIVDNSESGDLVITADIPLAAQLVEKRVWVVDPRGEVYDENNVAGRLAARDFLDAARGAGMELSGPPPYSVQDRNAFAAAFDRTLTRALRKRAP